MEEKVSSEDITYHELLSKCFSRETLKTVQAWKRPGLDVVQLCWDKPGNPLNQQFLWVLYSRISLKKIKNFLDALKNYCAIAEQHHMLVIDDYNPKTDLLTNIMVLSDNGVSFNGFTLTCDDGSQGNLGYIVGQGRKMSDDLAIGGMLHTIAANFFSRRAKDKDSKLKDNAFMHRGIKKVNDLMEALNKMGVKVDYSTLEEIRGMKK